jgi:hypothetical protein
MKHDTEYPLVASNYNITQKKKKKLGIEYRKTIGS